MSRLVNKLIKNSRAESGFTLIEVVVASLIVFLFIVGSMQALVLSAALRVKAQARQRGSQLIQEDMEQIRFAAENLAVDHSRCSATGYSGGYAEALVADASFPAGNPTNNLIEGNTDSITYRLERNFDDSTNTVLKVSYKVKDRDRPEPAGNTDDDFNVVAENYTEVIPDAAIQCP